MELNYYQTLIAVADDCPVPRGTAPSQRGDKPTVATLQYDMLAGSPHAHTQEDVLFATWLAKQEFTQAPSAAERARLRKEFFAKPQACLRASPLPKKYGFGLLFDRAGKVALCPMESAEYQLILSKNDSGVRILKAMRTKRA